MTTDEIEVPQRRSRGSGAARLARIALEKLPNNGADATTLAGGPSSRAAMQVLR